MRRDLVAAIIAVTALTWFVAALIFGLPESLFDAARPFASALTVATLLLWVYDNWIWSMPIFHGNLTRIPDLRGVWEVRIQSTWLDVDLVQHENTIDGFAQIDQTATTICMRMFTSESESETIAFSFELSQSVFRLVMIYQNKPHIRLRDSKASALHQGSASFTVRGYVPSEFAGEYWTERRSIGTIALHNRISGEINSFAAGQRLYRRVE